MESLYLPLRAIHIGAALLGFALFLLRAVAVNGWRSRGAMARPVRRLAIVIDTALLIAALMLMSVIGQNPLHDGWLTAKVLLLFAYIALGYLALRAATPARRWTCLAGATLLFGLIYSIARAHHPLGLFA